MLEIIKAQMEMPPGLFIFEDPPDHDLHRGIMSRVFTPRRMAAIEPQVRDYAARTLDPLVGKGGFDFILDLGTEIPMRTIGMLLGIPEEDQQAIRNNIDEGLRLEEGVMPEVDFSQGGATESDYGAYIDWRVEHPSDDLMTELLNAEFTDVDGTVRTLTRDEILGYIGLLSGAGNETTTRLIGWAGKLLAEHPDQRAQMAADPSLIPAAIEECLRFEPPSPVQSRYVTTDVEHYGQTVPAGSVMVLLNASANRDEREFDDPDRFDIHPQGAASPELRLRPALLPRGAPRTPRGARRPRRGPEAVPGVGGRHGQRRAGAHLDGAGLGEAAGTRPVTETALQGGAVGHREHRLALVAGRHQPPEPRPGRVVRLLGGQGGARRRGAGGNATDRRAGHP